MERERKREEKEAGREEKRIWGYHLPLMQLLLLLIKGGKKIPPLNTSNSVKQEAFVRVRCISRLIVVCWYAEPVLNISS